MNFYQQYMNSPEWFERRQLRLERDGHRCKRCGHDDALQVHHVRYDNLGKEPMADLITLCDRCHSDEHEKQHIMKRVIAETIEILRITDVTEEEYMSRKKQVMQERYVFRVEV